MPARSRSNKDTSRRPCYVKRSGGWLKQSQDQHDQRVLQCHHNIIGLPRSQGHKVAGVQVVGHTCTTDGVGVTP